MKCKFLLESHLQISILCSRCVASTVMQSPIVTLLRNITCNFKEITKVEAIIAKMSSVNMTVWTCMENAMLGEANMTSALDKKTELRFLFMKATVHELKKIIDGISNCVSVSIVA